VFCRRGAWATCPCGSARWADTVARRMSHTGTQSPAGEVAALTKPHARKVWTAQAKLGAYQDEKLDIYKEQLGHMAGVFENAREVRNRLQDEYDSRNQFIVDTLAEMRNNTDARCRVHQERLKEFSNKFDEEVTQGKKGLRAQLVADLTAAGRRHAAVQAELVKLNDAIQQEIKDCQEHTAAETGPIAAKLQEYSEDLDRQVAERHRHQDEYCVALKEHAAAIRLKLRAEAKAREEQIVNTQKQLEKQYKDMDSVREREAVSLKERFEDWHKRFEEQKVDRASAQASVVKDMVHYMEQFEKAVADMKAYQDKTSSSLQTMKTKTHFDEMK